MIQPCLWPSSYFSNNSLPFIEMKNVRYESKCLSRYQLWNKRRNEIQKLLDEADEREILIKITTFGRFKFFWKKLFGVTLTCV